MLSTRSSSAFSAAMRAASSAATRFSSSMPSTTPCASACVKPRTSKPGWRPASHPPAPSMTALYASSVRVFCSTSITSSPYALGKRARSLEMVVGSGWQRSVSHRSLPSTEGLLALRSHGSVGSVYGTSSSAALTICFEIVPLLTPRTDLMSRKSAIEAALRGLSDESFLEYSLSMSGLWKVLMRGPTRPRYSLTFALVPSWSPQYSIML
mmetsp:Transcript_65554/g.136541  ORF Transcript_65554/g.136541 Transcript_65554/m.136541 type:complete len:210 (-) Transcript_65554:162-791(-)